ncbi:MAG: ATP-binding cassette domain-containing protein, partial [Actinomycetota bacterium]
MTADGGPVLELRGVHAGYGAVRVLTDVSLEVRRGEIVCLLGPNAAGKTTTLRAILGLTSPSAGQIHLDGERVDGLPTPRIVAKGITMVPENRRLFARMTVRENLEIGAQ